MKFPLDTFWNPQWHRRARQSEVARYGFSLFCALCAALAWFLMAPRLHDATPFQLLVPFVALSAWFGGAGPGFFTTALCALWVVLSTPNSRSSLPHELEFSVFLLVGSLVAALCGSLGQARREIEETVLQLTASRERYQSIVETASEGIWTLDAHLQTTFANARMARLLGTTPDAMQGHFMGDWMKEDDRSALRQSLQEGELEKYFRAERCYLGAGGEEIWFGVNITLIRDEKGRFAGILALHTDITGPRRQREALRQSHERFERATRAIAGYIYEWNVSNGEVQRSTGFETIMGYDPQLVPASNQWWQSRVHPDDAPRVQEEFEAAMRANERFSNERFSVEYRALHADGSYRWLWDQGLFVREDDGALHCVVAAVSDISGRKSMEVALREGEATFRQLADAMPQIVWSSNPRGVPDYFNQRWYDFCGQPPGLVGAGLWEEVIHPEDFENASQRWTQCMETGQTYRVEMRLRDKQGTYRWFLCRSLPMRDEANGDIIRWFGTATDIDDQKRLFDAQTYLAEASAILFSSLDYEITLERITRLAVPVLCDWCFVTLKNAQGKPEMLAAAHQDPQKVAEFWERHQPYGLDPNAPRGFAAVMRTGVPELVPQITPDVWKDVLTSPEYQKKAQEVGHRSTLIVPLESGGKVLGTLGFSHAESDRRFSDADLPLAQELARRAALAIDNARLYRELQQADRRKDEFLAMLAHELRNPLAAISGARALLDELLEGDAKVLTATPRAIMERQITQLARLVDDLLDVSRITRGRIELRRETVDFNEIVRGALESARPLMLSRRHDLRLELPQEPLPVDADPARLSQIVSNLANNAAKYTDPGGKIVVSLETEGEEAVLRVRDNGTGLKSEMLHSIWDLFVQNDRTLDRAQGGLGIGLTLVKSLAEMHGGRVAATSQGLGLGSEFLVALPRLELPSSQENAMTMETKKDEEIEDKSVFNTRNRVLVVDDNHDAARMISSWLENRGHDVQVAYNGMQGLILACGWQPEIVILDIGMPEMDGYAVARQLRALPEGKRMRLIALTGYGQPADQTQAFEAGFDFHLTKPVDIEELRRVIDL